MGIDSVSNSQSAFPTGMPENESYAQQVVKETQKAMNGAGFETSIVPAVDQGITDKATFGAAVVTKTLDYMNSGGSGSMSAEYDFQTKVLNAAMAGRGSLTDTKI
jgi:hypothetical protein